MQANFMLGVALSSTTYEIHRIFATVNAHVREREGCVELFLSDEVLVLEQCTNLLNGIECAVLFLSLIKFPCCC